MKNAGYISCKTCGKRVPLVVAKNRRKRCFKCAGLPKLRPFKMPKHRVRSDEELLRLAYATSPWFFRLFHLSVSKERLLDHLGPNAPFVSLLQPGDRVLPFHFNQDTFEMRKGYVLVRDGKACEVCLTAVS